MADAPHGAFVKGASQKHYVEVVSIHDYRTKHIERLCIKPAIYQTPESMWPML